MIRNEATPGTQKLEALCQGLAMEIERVLPKGIQGLLLLAEKGEGFARVTCASSIEDELAVVALYDWIETRGIVVDLAQTVRRARALMKRTGGRGIQASVTPASALAMGIMAGLLAAPGAGEVPMEDVAAKAVEILEQMLEAEPIAKSELEAERAAASSGRQA